MTVEHGQVSKGLEIPDGVGYKASVVGTRILVRVAITFLGHWMYDVWVPAASFLYAVLIYDFAYQMFRSISNGSLAKGLVALTSMGLVAWAGSVNPDLVTGVQWLFYKIGSIVKPDIPSLVYWNERHTFLVWGMVWATMLLVTIRAAATYYLSRWWQGNLIGGQTRRKGHAPFTRFFLKVVE